MIKFYNAYRLIKRIPNALVILFLILLTGLAEGVGISALVPVLSSLTGEFSEGQLPAPFNFLPECAEKEHLKTINSIKKHEIFC